MRNIAPFVLLSLIFSQHHLAWHGQRKVMLQIRLLNRWTGQKLSAEQMTHCGQEAYQRTQLKSWTQPSAPPGIEVSVEQRWPSS